jgi:hypothetical protein
LKAKYAFGYVNVHAYVVPVYWRTTGWYCVKLGTVIAILLDLVERLLVFVEVAVLDHDRHGLLHSNSIYRNYESASRLSISYDAVFAKGTSIPSSECG